MNLNEQQSNYKYSIPKHLDTLESEPDGVKIDVDMLLMMAQAAIDAANKILQKDPLAENKNDVKG